MPSCLELHEVLRRPAREERGPWQFRKFAATRATLTCFTPHQSIEQNVYKIRASWCAISLQVFITE